MNLFDILRHHVATRPTAIASRSGRRAVTYRRFWSRIERATARLQGEWQVKPGDTVAYWGRGHQDALMLYLALARCGARLLPLEHASLQRNAAAILRAIPVAVLLHDDDTLFDEQPAVPLIVTLSSLIATRCHHTPPVDEDDTQISLLTLAQDGAMPPHIQNTHSLRALSADDGTLAPDEFRVAETLFDTDVLATHVLPVLRVGGTILFR